MKWNVTEWQVSWNSWALGKQQNERPQSVWLPTTIMSSDHFPYTPICWQDSSVSKFTDRKRQYPLTSWTIPALLYSHIGQLIVMVASAFSCVLSEKQHQCTASLFCKCKSDFPEGGSICTHTPSGEHLLNNKVSFLEPCLSHFPWYLAMW